MARQNFSLFVFFFDPLLKKFAHHWFMASSEVMKDLFKPHISSKQPKAAQMDKVL